MLSYNNSDDSIPIAYRKYTSNNAQGKNKILYIDQSFHNNELKPEDISDDKLVAIFGTHALRSMKAKREKREKLVELYNGTEEAEKFNDVEINDKSNFRVIPYALGYTKDDSYNRFVFFLNGASGSGKSYFSTEILEIGRMFGIKKIYVITDIKDSKFGKVKYLNINTLVGENFTHEESKKEYEKAKIKFKYKRKLYKDDPEMLMNLELALHDMKPEAKTTSKFEFKLDKDQRDAIFQDSIVLFDDYENNPDIDKIEFLRDNLLTKGRHTSTSLIICNHKGSDGGHMKLIKIETTDYVFFNKGTDHERNYLLRTYLGFDKEQIKRVKLALKKSRWISINPNEGFAITQKEAFMV